MKYTHVLAALLISCVWLSAAAAQTTISGEAWETYNLFDGDNGYCIAVVDVPDGQGYIDTELMYLAPNAQAANKVHALPGESPCDYDTEHMQLTANGWRVFVTHSEAIREGVVPYHLLQTALQREELAGSDAQPPYIQYFHAAAYERVPTKTQAETLATRDTDNLRKRTDDFMRDWYVRMDEQRFWSYVAKTSPLRNQDDAFSSAFTNAQPDPATFSSWLGADPGGCLNSAAKDGFCVFTPAEFKHGDGYERWLASERLRKYMQKKQVKTNAVIAFVWYPAGGSGYRSEIMLTLWVRERPGLFGKLVGRQPPWRLFSFFAYD